MRRTYAPRMKTVLVVDDERNIVELVRLYLEKEGFNVVAAGDGERPWFSTSAAIRTWWCWT